MQMVSRKLSGKTSHIIKNATRNSTLVIADINCGYLLYLTECLLGYPTCKIIAIDLNKKKHVFCRTHVLYPRKRKRNYSRYLEH